MRGLEPKPYVVWEYRENSKHFGSSACAPKSSLELRAVSEDFSAADFAPVEFVLKLTNGRHNQVASLLELLETRQKNFFFTSFENKIYSCCNLSFFQYFVHHLGRIRFCTFEEVVEYRHLSEQFYES